MILLEEKRLSYIVACRFNNSIKIQLASQVRRTEVADSIHIAESTYQAQGWKNPRHIIMVRHVRTMNQRQAFLGLWRTAENFDITRTNWAK
ncbi:MAG: hypothetical protein IJ546_03350 [Prevotella sp.]|nr:hypothetical protein [Prevotella sp.]